MKPEARPSKSKSGRHTAPQLNLQLEQYPLQPFMNIDPYLSEADKAQWRQMFDGFMREIGPKTIIEELLVAEVVNATWEIAELRRAKADLLRLDRRAAMEKVLVACSEGDPKDRISQAHQQIEVAAKWATGDPDAEREATAMLASHGLQKTVVQSQSYENKRLVLEGIERQISVILDRREKHYREIERIRAVLAIRARDAATTLLDHSVSDVDVERA